MAHDELVGRSSQPFRFQVETGKVREFAHAVHARSSLHLDEAAAQSAGFTGLVAPPTFSAAAHLWASADDDTALLDDLDLARVLAGGAEWIYTRPITAGETLTASAAITDVRHKTGRWGGMTVIVIETRYEDASGQTPLIARSTVIELDEAPNNGKASHD